MGFEPAGHSADKNRGLGYIASTANALRLIRILPGLAVAASAALVRDFDLK